MKTIATFLVLVAIATPSFACDRSSFAADLIVYDKVCAKLPADYLAAYKKAAVLVIEEMLAEAQENYKSDPKYCQNSHQGVATSIAYFKKHRRVESC